MGDGSNELERLRSENEQLRRLIELADEAMEWTIDNSSDAFAIRQAEQIRADYTRAREALNEAKKRE